MIADFYEKEPKITFLLFKFYYILLLFINIIKIINELLCISKLLYFINNLLFIFRKNELVSFNVIICTYVQFSLFC